jgi:uncharacterized protein (TIGR02099 family)
MIHHFKRATRHLIFWSLILAAIALSAVRVVLTSVESYKANLETRISLLVGTPVKLGSIGTHMRGISPELVLKDIHFDPILATEKPSLQLQEIRLGMNLGEFLLNRDILSSAWVTVVGAKLSIYRKPDGEFAVEGLRAGKGPPLWLLQGQQYQVLHSQITWQDKQKQAASLVLEDVNLEVMNNGDRHQIRMLATPPETLADSLSLVLDVEGSIDKSDEIKGKGFIAANNVKLPGLLAGYLPYDLQISSGITDVKAWGLWHQGALADVTADVKLRQAVFSRKDKGVFHINGLDTLVSWHDKANQWRVDVARFLLETSEDGNKTSKKWPDAIVSLAAEPSSEKALKNLKLYAKQLDLAEAARLTQFFALTTLEQIHKLNQAQVSGLIRNFSLYAEPANNGFALAGWFDSINVEPVQSMPGITNLSGQIKGSEKMGKVELASEDLLYKSPQLFSKPLLLTHLKGILAWQQTDEQWIVSSQSIMLDCPAFDSENRMRIEIPKTEGKPFIDLQMAFESNDLSQVGAYLPTQIMQDKLKAWLTTSFLRGKVKKGDLLFYGKPSDFPFKDGTGVFEAKLDVENVELKYHPEWPKISGIKGEVAFDKDNILGKFNQGMTEKAVINKAEMSISGLGSDELLTIKGEGQAEINQGLSILQHSPLANQVTPLLAGLSLQGSTNADLELSIPLRPGHEMKVDGKAQLNNSQLTVNRLNLKVNNVNGDIKFNKQGVYGEKIKATALGRPIQVDITQAEQNTLVDVSGKAKVRDIENLFDWTGSQPAAGESNYLLQLQIPKIVGDNNPLAITVNSTLEGVELNLPGTLAKSKAQKKPSTLTVQLGNEQVMPIDLDYNNELKAAISLNAQERKIVSGHILIGNGTAKQTKIAGLKLEVSREQLPLQEWLAMGAGASQQAGKQAINLNEIYVHSQSAFWNKTRLGGFDLTLKRNPSHWVGEIESSVAKGKFQFPLETSGINPVILDMEMLNLSALKHLKMQEGGSTNSDFKPLLNINSKKTLWQSQNLGHLVVETQRNPKGIDIKRLELLGDDQKLFMTGNWREAGIKSITHINGKLEIKKADELFDKLNITRDLTSASGVIDFKLNWNAAPWQLSMPALQGTMDVRLKEGRILSIEPGFGRVLGILAVAQWIKRLQLDFTDIYEEGLAFNSIKGHFDLLNGVAATKGLVIDAVPAKITIMGDTNLVNQTLDQVIKVVPKSLDALPIAGTIVSRVAAMVGKTLTGEDQEGFFFGTQYMVKGNWNDIKISSQRENDGLFQKTWKSITDFPWDEEQNKK